jgi:hypothetical protein
VSVCVSLSLSACVRACVSQHARALARASVIRFGISFALIC